MQHYPIPSFYGVPPSLAYSQYSYLNFDHLQPPNLQPNYTERTAQDVNYQQPIWNVQPEQSVSPTFSATSDTDVANSNSISVSVTIISFMGEVFKKFNNKTNTLNR